MTGSYPVKSEKAKFNLIEVGRAVASLLVVCHHAGNIMAQPRFFGGEPFASHFRNFNVGVDFFFVLSGFIIAWIHWSDIGEKSRLGSYLRKRFLRIYPPYWGVVIPLIMLYLIFPSAGTPSQRDPVNIILSIFLLPYVAEPVLGVAWTLTHEIFFYALFALILVSGRRSLMILPLWGLAILVAHLAEPLPYPLSFFLSPFNLEFIMGVGAAALLKHRSIPQPFAFAATGAIVFLALTLFAVHIQDDPLIGRLAFGIASVFFVLGAVEIERRQTIRLPPGLLFLGAASYAIYLVHPVALSFGVQALTRLAHRAIPLDIAALILFAISVAAGSLYHVVAEKNLVRIVGAIFFLRDKKGFSQETGTILPSKSAPK
jgi:peptidoglycan/LPS O-acetylase OafA/YrhL